MADRRDSKPERLTLFTSIYPWPWDPVRGVFNKQQYDELETVMDVDYIIPVPFFFFFRYLRRLLDEMRGSNRLYFPFFYFPGMLRSWNIYFLAFSTIVSVLPLIRLKRSRVVMASWAYPDAMACALLQPLLKFPLVIQCLGSDINVHCKIPRHRQQLCRGISRSAAVVTVSNALEMEVRKINAEASVHTVYNGVNFERFIPNKSEPVKKRLVFIGNLIVAKGVFELIEAFASVPHKDVTLDLIGDGPARTSLEERIRKLGLSNRVTLRGRIPHERVSELLPSYSALVLPSYSEGVPNVIVEALASGLPVIATDVGGIREVLLEDCGKLIAAQDHQALARAINETLSLRWNKEELRQSVSHLTWSSNATQIAQLIHRVPSNDSPW